MRESKEMRKLASYVTYRQLYNDGKNDVYTIISKFAENIIITQSLYSFGLTEMSEKINDQFGFCIPDYVIQSSLKRLKYVMRSEHRYTVDTSEIKMNADIVSNSMANSSNINQEMVNSLVQYVQDKTTVLSEREREKLIQCFCKFLLDDTIANGYSELISSFVIENSDNPDFKSNITEIKEGAVLFAGLNYNSNISDNSVWKDELVLYVENEILFHLAGYNGDVFQKLTEELFSLISEMNTKSKTKVIKVRYFEEVSNEIDVFFAKACDIVSGKEYVSAENYAMSEIINGCQNEADVIEKKTKFYRMLKNKNIFQEKDRNYYLDKEHKYNLISQEDILKYGIEEDKMRYITHLNYVNVLRKGENIKDLKKAKYIVLTETGKILKMASEFCENSGFVPLAINMGVLTNRLWFDLNKGFGASEFPSTFDILVKAKIVLSKILTESVADKFEQAKKRYLDQEITEEQLSDNILMLREEIKKPEDINKNVLENVLSFLSEENLAIHQSEKELLSIKLQKANEKNDSLMKSMKKNEEGKNKLIEESIQKNADLQRKNVELLCRNKENLEQQIEEIEKRKKNADKKIQKKISNIKPVTIGSIIFYCLFLLFVFLKSNEDIQVVITIVLAIIPPAIITIISLIVDKKVDFFKLYELFIKWIEKRIEKKTYSSYFVDKDKLRKLKEELAEVEAGLKAIKYSNEA